MSSSTAEPKRRSWRRRLRLGLLLGLALLLVAWFARYLWLGPIIANLAESALEEELGGRWHVSVPTGNYFTSCRIDRISLREADPDGALLTCDLRAVELDYTLTALLGEEPSRGIRRVQLTDGQIHLVVPEASAESQQTAGPAADISLPPLSAELQLDLACDLSIGRESEFRTRLRIDSAPLTALATLELADPTVDGESLPPLAVHLTSWQTDQAEARLLAPGWRTDLIARWRRDGWRCDGDMLGATFRATGQTTGTAQQGSLSWEDLQLDQLSASLPGLVDLSLSGRLDGQVRWAADTHELAVSGQDLSIGPVELDQVNMRGRLLANGGWWLDQATARSDRFDLQGEAIGWHPQSGLTQLQQAELHLSIPGMPDPLHARLGLQATELKAELRLAGAGLEASGQATLDAGSLTESAWRQAAFRLQADARATQAELPETGLLLGHGSLSLDLQGTVTQPAGSGQLELRELGQGDRQLDRFAMQASLTPEALRLEDLAIIIGVHGLQLAEATELRWNPEGWRLRPLALRGPSGDISLAGHGRASGIDAFRADWRIDLNGLAKLLWGDGQLWQGHWQGQATLAPQDGELSIDQEAVLEAHPQGPAFPTVQARSRIHADVLAATPELKALVDVTGGLQGHIEWSLPLPDPQQADWLMRCLDTPGSGQLVLQLDRLDTLADLLPSHRDLNLSGGLRAEAHLRGSLQQPEPTATVTLKQVGATIAGLPAMRGFSGRIEMDQTACRIERVDGSIGGGPCRLQGTLPWTKEEAWDLQIRLRDVITNRSNQLRVRVDADLTVTGLDLPEIAGQIGIVELALTTPVEYFGRGGISVDDPLLQLFSITEEPFNDWLLDLHIRNGSLDQAVSEAKPLRIRNNIFSGTGNLDLRIAGTAEVPEPTGRIRCLGARVALPFTSYRVDRAAITFPPDNPFDPDINATAATRMQGYEVSVLVEGKLLDPRVEVTTSPPLSQEAAFLLASTGSLPREVQQDNLSSGLGTLLPWLGREIGRLTFGPGTVDDTDDSFFDRLEIRLDEERSEAGRSTGHFAYRLSDHWYLFGERDRFEEYNTGIMWRWRFGGRDPLQTGAEERQADRDAAIAWQIESVPAGKRLPLLRSSLARLVRPQLRLVADPEADELLLSEASQIMTEALRTMGYLDASCTVASEAIDPPTILRWGRPAKSWRISFLLDPGIRWFIDDVHVSGLPDQELQLADLPEQVLKPGAPCRPAYQSEASQALVSSLRLRGYPRVKVEADWRRNEETGLATAVFQVDAGARWTFGPARFSTATRQALTPDLLEQVTTIATRLQDSPYRRTEVHSLRARLRDRIRQDGFLFASATVEADPTPGQSVIPILIDIHPGPATRLRAIHFNGLDRTSTTYARQRLDLAEDSLLHGDAYDRGMSRLRRTTIFSRLSGRLERIAEPAADADEVTVDLHIDAEEGANRSLAVHAGWGTYEQLRGGVRYEDRNLFGWGRHWVIDTELSQKHYAVRTDLRDRDILGPEREMTVSFGHGFREEPSFDRTVYSASLLASSYVDEDRYHRLLAEYRINFEKADERTAEIENAESDEFVSDAQFSLTWRWDRRDDRFLPTSGTLIELRTGISDQVLGSDVNYIEPRLRIGWHVQLADRWVLGLGGSGTVRQITDEANSLPIQYRLFLGGANDVRSFGTDELTPVNAARQGLGGLTAAEATAELRFPLGDLFSNFHGAVFYDIGSVDSDSWQLGEAVGEAVGAGLRYYLPVGPIRLDAGYNPGSDTLAADQRWAVHLAIGLQF